jgi:hypothetical protein
MMPVTLQWQPLAPSPSPPNGAELVMAALARIAKAGRARA